MTVNNLDLVGTDNSSICKAIFIHNVQGDIVVAEGTNKPFSCKIGFKDSVKSPSLLPGDLSNGIEVAEITVMVRLASRCFDFAEYGSLPFNCPCADEVGNDRCSQDGRKGSGKG